MFNRLYHFYQRIFTQEAKNQTTLEEKLLDSKQMDSEEDAVELYRISASQPENSDIENQIETKEAKEPHTFATIEKAFLKKESALEKEAKEKLLLITGKLTSINEKLGYLSSESSIHAECEVNMRLLKCTAFWLVILAPFIAELILHQPNPELLDDYNRSKCPADPDLYCTGETSDPHGTCREELDDYCDEFSAFQAWMYPVVIIGFFACTPLFLLIKDIAENIKKACFNSNRLTWVEKQFLSGQGVVTDDDSTNGSVKTKTNELLGMIGTLKELNISDKLILMIHEFHGTNDSLTLPAIKTHVSPFLEEKAISHIREAGARFRIKSLKSNKQMILGTYDQPLTSEDEKAITSCLSESQIAHKVHKEKYATTTQNNTVKTFLLFGRSIEVNGTLKSVHKAINAQAIPAYLKL